MSIQQRLRAAFRGIRSGDAGLSMAEVIVALMVFSILATCVAYGLTNTLVQTQHSRARESALALASQDLDSLRLRALNTKDGILQVTSTSAPLYQTVGGTQFGLERDVDWADTTGNLGACGTGTGTLAYKNVVDTVSWRLSSTSPTQKVTMVTSIAPISNLNTDTTGTIIVSIIGADGAAESGVTVAMTPVTGGAALASPPQPTDSDGCSFGLKAVPGTYKVTATRAGGIDFQQNDPATNSSVVVKAGQNTMVNFSYDTAAQFPITYPALAAVAPDMGLGLVNPTSGTATYANAPASVKAYPWQDGYSVVAGNYVGGTGSASCLSPNPISWQTADTDGAIGVASPATATQPGTTAPPTAVRMGVVAITGLGGSDYVTAVTSTAAGKGDPGCSASKTLTFSVKFNKIASIALPFGTWTLFSGSKAGDKSKNLVSALGAGAFTIVGRGTVNTTGAAANTVTIDPRQVVTP